MHIWSNPINLIHISIFGLLYFEYLISYHVGMTQYSKILQNCISVAHGYFCMQHKNFVLQLIHICQKLII